MPAKSARVLSLSILLVLIDWNGEYVFCGCSLTRTGRLMFEENFDSAGLNDSVWHREIKIPYGPDYEFCVYHKHNETVEINNGILRIRPSLFEDSYGEDSTLLGQLRLADCSSSIPEECNRQATSYNILPPVISAKLVTRNHFEFRYGVIELRAKFPEGDWLYPEIWLEPLYKSYDKRYANARIDLGRARGNAVLSHLRGQDLSGNYLEFGAGSGTGSEFEEETVSKLRRSGGAWNKDFHTYKTVWSSNGLTFYVDGELVGKIVPTASGWSKQENAEAVDIAAPFDDKFYLSIGLGVGGTRIFPDGTQSNTYVKPWRNINAKAMLRFWQSRDTWLPSWQINQGAKTALEIDYIKVWTLD